MSNIAKWFEQQQEKGLVDIKLSITPGKGITAGKVVDELLAAEAAIQAGHFRAPPVATSDVPAEINAILAQSKLCNN